MQALAEMLLRARLHRVMAPSLPRQQHVTHPPSFPLRSVRFLLVFNNCFQFPFLRDQRGAKALAAPAYLARTSKADTAVWGALNPACLLLLPMCVLRRPLLHLP